MTIVPGNPDYRTADGDGLDGSEPRRFPRDLPPLEHDREYQLTRCEGFRVEADGQRLGIVAEVRFGSRVDVPDLIAVRVRRLGGHRLLLVPVGEVAAIDPHVGVIRLEASPERTEPTRRRLALLRDRSHPAEDDGDAVARDGRRTSREGRDAYHAQPAHADPARS